ncbi:Uncharacterized protein APZ42_033940 [Daphnia magna]|uniref:SWIM-type domain-containing protein n=1 Tax=Daphnia magna TaxID=35525 RepID=A0A164KKN1_9CRUS|nr:Uncharacterized protein APZ42_033940 [Daphnia magna]
METEDWPMPTIGLACLIHLRKLQSSHEYFWNMVKKEIPEIASSKKLLICTDQEAAIVNSIEKIFPNIPRARCHIYAWIDQKMKLRSLGISSRLELAKYRSHFYELLHQKSYIEYCAVSRSFQRNCMNTVNDASRRSAKKYLPSLSTMQREKLMIKKKYSGSRTKVLECYCPDWCKKFVNCCHIMAAMMSIGYKHRTSNRIPNGTRMRSNMNKKADSHSGTKSNRRVLKSKGNTRIHLPSNDQRKERVINNDN